MSLGVILVITVQAVSRGVRCFFNPTGVLRFSVYLYSVSSFALPAVLVSHEMATGISAHPSHPISLLPTLSCRCLGEDALRAIRPPPREACLSLPASFLFREQRMPSKRELTPPLCTLNQPLPFANFCFFQKNPTPDPGLSGSERPRLQGRGNGSSIAAGRAPSSPPLLPFSYVFGWDCGCAGGVLSWEPAGRKWSPKVLGGCTPWGLPVWGGRGAEAPTAIGNRVLASPTMPLAARLGSLGIYIILLLFYFFW